MGRSAVLAGQPYGPVGCKGRLAVFAGRPYGPVGCIGWLVDRVTVNGVTVSGEAVLASKWPQRPDVTSSMPLSWPILPIGPCLIGLFWLYWPTLTRYLKKKIKEEEENLWLLDLRLASRR